jgi:formate-dependent nitrite reductase membrane component NrfD
VTRPEIGATHAAATRPIIKQPVWTWEIPLYFYAGGLAGASAALAYGAGLTGNERLARRSWAAAMVGVTASPLFLISDLGKPSRFFNMLRVFKVTSPMSVGSWVLAASGATIAPSALNAWTGRLPRVAAASRPAAAALGLPLTTYTAALVADTAVPAWHEARHHLPFVFGASAVASAGAVAAACTPQRYAAPARTLMATAAALEVGITQAMERRLGGLASAYSEGTAGTFGTAATALNATGAVLAATVGRRSRTATAAAAALVTAGSICARWSVFKAGSQSAADPAQTVRPQRERIERAAALNGG